MAPKSGEAKARKIVFGAEGINIQDGSGNSMTYAADKRPSTNLTFPGSVLQDNLETNAPDAQAVIDLWKHETGLPFNFSSRYRPKPDCRNCSRINAPCTGGRPCTRCRERNLQCAFGLPKLTPVNQSSITNLFQPQPSSQAMTTLPVPSQSTQLGPSTNKKPKLFGAAASKQTAPKKA